MGCLLRTAFLFKIKTMDIQKLYEKFVDCNFQVCTDTRNIVPGSLFVALKGERFDANHFIDEAIHKGCKYAVGEYYDGNNRNVIIVDNSLKTLQQLAHYHRTQMSAKIIAIAGSNGKTTTKELMAAVLSKKYKISFTKGNFNNHIGVPLTLLQMNPETEIAIVEMGANHANELELLCQLADPDYGIVTNLGKEHLGEFGSYEAVVETETYLYRYLSIKNGYAFVCADEKALFEHSSDIRKSLYGNCKSCDVKLVEAKLNPLLLVKWENNSNHMVNEVQSKLFGLYNAQNILAAICVGEYFNVPTELIVEAIESYVPYNHRSQWMKIGSNDVIIDAYNANPTSMQLAIESFFEVKMPNKVLILGDMLELGVYEDEEHLNILKLIENKYYKQLYLVGDNFRRVLSNVSLNAKTFQNVDQLIGELKQHPISNSTIFIKGSHGIHLEKLMEVFNESR